MEKNWFKISEKQPAFDVPVIVKTVQSVYAIAELTEMKVSKSGIEYKWWSHIVDLEDDNGDIVEWCEIPK